MTYCPYLVIPSHCELIVIADNDNLQEPDDVKEYNVVLDSADLIPIPDKIKEAAQCGLLTKNRNPDFDNQSGKQNELPPHCRHCTFLFLVLLTIAKCNSNKRFTALNFIISVQ